MRGVSVPTNLAKCTGCAAGAVPGIRDQSPNNADNGRVEPGDAPCGRRPGLFPGIRAPDPPFCHAVPPARGAVRPGILVQPCNQVRMAAPPQMIAKGKFRAQAFAIVTTWRPELAAPRPRVPPVTLQRPFSSLLRSVAAPMTEKPRPHDISCVPWLLTSTHFGESAVFDARKRCAAERRQIVSRSDGALHMSRDRRGSPHTVRARPRSFLLRKTVRTEWRELKARQLRAVRRRGPGDMRPYRQLTSQVMPVEGICAEEVSPKDPPASGLGALVKFGTGNGEVDRFGPFEAVG